jgi:hypothetical protein
MIKRLEKYTWGLGIEHEMHIFHKPCDNKSNIDCFTLFDSEKITNRYLNEKNSLNQTLSEDEYTFLKGVPFETSGRKCNDKWVIKMVPIKMPEFITNHPFCSIKNKRSLINMSREIRENKEKFYNLMKKDNEVKELIKNYGELSEYPTGMTRYLRYPVSTKKNKYKFDKTKNGKSLLVPEYNGSYHVTFTLPNTEKTSSKRFLKIHQNFANQLQWLEPLMLAAYFTGDEYAPGTGMTRVRGSFRVMIIGWGNFAGSDIRLFNKGIGRYAKTKTYWRDGLKFIDSDKLKPCLKPSPAAKKENAYSTLSSDFRTFGSTDPERPWHRESGVPMTKPNGIEFRIFDHFSDKYIEHLILFISLVAENSRLKQTKGYVYENKIWINELHNIMKNGYCAELSLSYIKLLREKLGLKIKTKSIIANDIFKCILNELFDKNIMGEWSRIFHCNKLTTSSIKVLKNILNTYPDINKKGWFVAFIMKLNREKPLLNKFNKLTNILYKLKNIPFNNLKKIILKLTNKNWCNDITNICYFYKFIGLCKLIKNDNGTIKQINFIKKQDFKNFNSYLIQLFKQTKLENIL